MSAHTVAGAAPAARCPRCGADAAGAPWCPSCGLNLRVRTEQPAPPSPPAPARGAGRSRGFVVAVLAGILAVAAAAVAVALLATRSSSHTVTAFAQAETIVRTVVPTQPAPAATPVAPRVTTAEMEDVLAQYANAYSAEDAASLATLFAPDLVRQNGGDPPERLAGALATYERQFAGLTNPHYILGNMRYTPGDGAGMATGRYLIEHAGGSASGSIGFHFVARDGRVLIDAIEIEPS
jgi:hypothetical protein